MKLLLIRQESSLYKYSNTSYGLGLIGTIASQVSDVKIIDNNSLYKIYSEKEFISEIERYKPDVIGFNVHAFNILATRNLVSFIKKHFPKICLIAGGLHTFSQPEEVLDVGVHVVVKGEADCVIKPLLLILEEAVQDRVGEDFGISADLGRKLYEIPGLLFYSEGCSGVNDSGESVLLENLDVLPFVNYDLFNLDDFLKGPDDDHYVTNVLITQRGCPFPCPFCRINGATSMAKVRENSTEYKMAYVQYIYQKYHPKHLVFYDNNFTLNRQSAISFCHKFIENGFNKLMSFSCQTNVVLKLDDFLLSAMKEASCTEVGLGIERLSKKSLELINKNKDYESIIHNVDMINKYNIDIMANCLVGFPFDTKDTIEEEGRLFEELKYKIKVFSINNLLPPPGTEIYLSTKYKKWYLDDEMMGWKQSFYHMVYNFSNNSLEINFFDLDNETIRAIRLMKEHYYSVTIKNLGSRLVDFLHFFEKILAKVSFCVYQVSPAIEGVLFYLPKKIRNYFHGYFLSNYYVDRSSCSND